VESGFRGSGLLFSFKPGQRTAHSEDTGVIAEENGELNERPEFLMGVSPESPKQEPSADRLDTVEDKTCQNSISDLSERADMIDIQNFEQPSIDWTCSTCTYSNIAELEYCEMCETEKDPPTTSNKRRKRT
jgi:hypothetical protein